MTCSYYVHFNCTYFHNLFGAKIPSKVIAGTFKNRPVQGLQICEHIFCNIERTTSFQQPQTLH